MYAAVLAGGKSSRMNFNDKSTLSYMGKSFLQRIVNRLNSFEKVLIISDKNYNMSPETKIGLYSDLIKGIGPLGGILTALKNSESRHVFVTTCDMPLITEQNINLICSFIEYDIVIPVFNGKYEMLFALYSKNCLPQIEKLITEKRYKITGLFEDTGLKIKKLPVNEEFMSSLRNINTTEDYRKLLEK